MKVNKQFLFCIMFFTISNAQKTISQAVTYELSPGRFGDNLISYIHAKWISYTYNIPLLYKPFVYSDQLVLHKRELLYTDNIKESFNKTIYLGNKTSVDPHDTSSILYIVPYFPESKWELKNCKSYAGGPWDYFLIDWHNKTFIEELRKIIKPNTPIIPMKLPPDRITVALHMRRGGNHDTPETLLQFPLKFLPNDFYIKQLHQLYGLLKEKPLYVYIFTDDNHPEKLAKIFEKHFQHYEIQFDYRKQGNSDTTNVIEDFFALDQFDCLIHSESNFSFIMNKISNYMISIYPDSFYKKNNQIIYDHINITINQ